MKQKLRRFMAGFLAILTMFTTLLTNGTTAFAASSSANIAFWVASSKDHGVISEFNSKHTGSILYAMIDGHSAYCMNFGLSAKGGQLMNSDSNPNTNLSAAQEKLLAYCMYYGYSTTEAKAPTNDQCNKYIATQSMVWIIVNGIFGTSSADSAASKLCACAPDSSSSYSYYETLRDKINASYNATRPSFASKTKSDATTYSKKELESITETVETIGKRNSCTIDVHYLKQREALNTALPIGVRQVETMRTMLTQSLAVLMPFNVQELNDEGGVYYGINQVSKNINIGNRKKLINGNGFVFGVPGSGKSFFCKAAMGQVFLSTDDEIIIIDPMNEYFDIATGQMKN